MKKAMMATWCESEESFEEEKEKEVANMCFMAIDDLDEGSKEDKWFLDSGCSRHMTEDESKFAFLTKRKGGYVTFEDNAKGRIISQDNLGKFDAKSDVGIFLGYSTSSKSFRVFNKRTMVVEESIHVIFDESNNSLQERESFDDDLGLETSMRKLQIEDKRQQEESGEDLKKEESPLALPPPQQVQGESSQDLPKDWKFVINHPQDQIIGNPSSGALYGLKQAPRAWNEPSSIKQVYKGSSQEVQHEEAKVMKTPMSSSIKLDMDEKGKSIDSTMYRGMIGSLLYLTASRPDIMYSVCLCARFQSCPKESHLSAVKRILRYLKGTMNIGLWYPKGDNFELIGFSDAHFAGCRVERRSTSDTCHFLGHSLVSWHSKKQNSVALSTAEAEYIAAGFGVIFDEILRLGFHLWTDLDFDLDGFLSVCEPSSGFAPFSRARAYSGLRASALLSPLSSLSRPRLARKARYDTASSAQLRIVRGTRAFRPEKGGSREKHNFSQLRASGLRDLHQDGMAASCDVYEAKAWPTILGFEPREAIQRLCGHTDAHGMGKPSVRSLTVPSRVLHHMICSILLPREDIGTRSPTIGLSCRSLLTGRRIHVGYVIMRHMMSCCESTTLVLPYGAFSLVSSRMLGRPSSQPSFTELPSQAPHAPDHPPRMDFSAQISSLRTRMEELAVVHDTRFYSMEDRIDQYQVGFTSQFEHLVQRIERLESRQERPKGSSGQGYGQPAQRLGNRFDRFPCPVEVRSREAQKPSLSPVAFSSRSSLTLVRRGRLRSGRGPIESVEATVTCHALNAPTASEPVDPLLVRRGYFLLFLSPELRNL
ncbi:Retrovirus-related Pol polyprotein from transposon RE1 [Vitis vinifera]|uniref:Retrovirus-related Pol polyprotein from transposon RE1 n=1 Tax=Vitis vinifera TaxID=29760 RepID=A0A438HJ25_VITVI|nr:Retrovirus-related Pol polyprotein from transposon RE1 [Vitis vinifera]